MDTSAGRVGPLSSDKIASGRTFTAAEANSDVALLDANYARQHKLATGSHITVGSATFTVIGTVAEPQGGTTTDVYIPLRRAQSLAGMTGQVNTIYVAAASAADITAVQQAIKGQLPKATVTTSSDLASQVTGSLTSASSLAGSLGKWLAIVVLIAAFAHGQPADHGGGVPPGQGVRHAEGSRLAQPPHRRPGHGRDAGHRRGRRGGRHRARLCGRGAGVLVRGAAVGDARPARRDPRPPGSAAAAGSVAAAPFGRTASDAAKTILVHLEAPVTAGIIVLAVLLAVAGGLIAGMFGGWRAARLRPAAALAQIQ